MFLRSILLVLSILRSAETCVPTVAPDEYYPTASLPEYTTRPMEATTTAEEEEMTTTAGGGSATVASTTALEEDMCEDCDFSELGPETNDPTNVIVATQEDTTDDGCKVTALSCRWINGAVCTTVEMRITNPTTSMVGTDDVTLNSVVNTFTCEKNGRYSYGSFTDITAISCTISGCTGTGK